MDVESVDWHHHINKSIDEYLWSCSFFNSFVVHEGAILEWSKVKFKELLKFGPKHHINWTKVVIQGWATPFCENLSVFVIYRQNQENWIHVKGIVDCVFEMIQEELNAGSEKRSKKSDSSFRLNVEKFSSKNDFMNDPIHQRFIHRFECLFKGKFLSFLTRHIIKNHIAWSK